MINENCLLSINTLLRIVKNDMEMEKYLAMKTGDMSGYDGKWAKLAAEIEQDDNAVGWLWMCVCVMLCEQC